MKKQDLIPIVLIVVLMLGWGKFGNDIVNKISPPEEKPAPVVVETTEEAPLPADASVTDAEPTLDVAKADAPVTETADTTEVETTTVEAEEIPEERHTLSNELIEVTLSSRGAGVVEAKLLDYPLVEKSEERVVYDFTGRPATAPIGYPGLAANAGFEVVAADELAVQYRKVLPNGLILSRTLTLDEGYQVRIEDQVENTSEGNVALSDFGLQAGFMVNLPGEEDARTPLLGVDTLTGSKDVDYWSKKFGKWFEDEDSALQTHTILDKEDSILSVDWTAVKGKYFTQILTPESAAEECRVVAAYGAPVSSTFLGIFPKTSYPMEKVSADLILPDVDLPAGQTLTQTSSWYMGPKVYGLLKANGPHQEDILQLGMWRLIGVLILKIIIWIHGFWPHSYGLAIILLTLLIRMIFWPLNHKSMASTRHMQEVQPIIAAMKEKNKDNPQQQQKEMMAIYKEHKINPMGGCLPMLVQIPVFFALFVVLRGAIELRFSSFLWISDLSTPENLFADVLPFPINILPIFMGVTMWIQQRMTPTSDPQQQKMMMMMPVLFTFMFYSFPSGLSLYWSINQVMMIFQLAWMKKFHPPKLVQA
jgi:YidC/Oxa1 family membrane protein insertase